jgi:hypothetical protein
VERGSLVDGFQVVDHGNILVVESTVLYLIAGFNEGLLQEEETLNNGNDNHGH